MKQVFRGIEKINTTSEQYVGRSTNFYKESKKDRKTK